MEALSTRELLLERRNSTTAQANLWTRLTLAQKFAASSLTQFGYDLAFIRDANNNGGLAILICNDSSATINGDGDVDTDPQIVIRP